MMGTMPSRFINSALMAGPGMIWQIVAGLKGEAVLGMEMRERKMDFGQMDIEPQETGYTLVGGRVAVISILGGLIYRGYGWGLMMTSYLDVRQAFRAALNDYRVKEIVFDIDSFGGEVAGVFDLVDEIYAARGAKPIVAIANETAFSAAYAIASAADKIYLPRTAEVGSIGVIAIHVDQSGYDEKIGVRYEAVYAGAKKNDYTSHEPLRDSARDALQGQVNKIYRLFVQTVARNRGLTQQAVESTEAGIFGADEAISAGLADGIADLCQVVNGLLGNRTGRGERMDFLEAKEAIKRAEQADIKALADDLSLLAREDAEAEAARAYEKGRVEAFECAADVVELCEVAGAMHLVVSLVRSRADIKAAKAAILAERAQASDANAIRSTIGAMSGTNGVLMARETEGFKAI